MDYESRMKYYSDYVDSLEYAKEKGVAIGEARGMEKAARAMKADGEAISKIMRYTGLSRNKIKELR